MKVCSVCKESKEYSDYCLAKYGKNGLSSKCRSCVSELAKLKRADKHLLNNTLCPSDRLKNKIGQFFTTNEGYRVEIIDCIAYNKCTILFDNGFILHNQRYRSIVDGEIANPLHRTVYGIGFLGIGNHIASIRKKVTKSYHTWNGILERGYSEKYKKLRPTYKEVTVCEEWYNFQNFAEWFEINFKDYMIGWHVDKDILQKGNKIYSPETCCFVPAEINILLTKNDANRGECLIGVSKLGSKYRAFLNSLENKYLGTFDTEIEAFYAYKIAKEKYIKKLADNYKGQITDDCYQALYNYEVELTD